MRPARANEGLIGCSCGQKRAVDEITEVESTGGDAF